MMGWKRAGQAGLTAMALGMAACTTTPQPEVVRFHLGGPIASGSVFVEPADPALSSSLEFRIYADEVRNGWQRLGFSIAPDRGSAEYVSTVLFSSAVRPGAPRQSPVTVGVGGGGGSFGRGGGFGGGGIGLSFPLGKRRAAGVALSELSVTLRRRSDQTAVWEGRAAVEGSAPARGLPNAAPLLVDAVFDKFPGPSGVSTRYRPGA